MAALRSVIFLKKKRCGRIKARLCADGRPQRKLYQKNDAASPTVKTESVLLTAVEEAEEGRDVAVVAAPRARRACAAFGPQQTHTGMTTISV